MPHRAVSRTAHDVARNGPRSAKHDAKRDVRCDARNDAGRPVRDALRVGGVGARAVPRAGDQLGSRSWNFSMR